MMTPIRMAVCRGSWVVAAKVISIATADSGATRSTSLISGSLPTTSSRPMTRMSPPMTGIGMISAADPATRTSSREPDAREDTCPTRLRPSRSRDAGPGERAARRQRAEEAADEVARTLCREVTGHVAAAAVGIGHRRRDARGLRQRDERDRDTADQQLGHHREVRNGERRKGVRDRGDVADGFDLDVRDGDHSGEHDEGDQDRERFQRFDEMEDRPYRDGARSDRDGGRLPQPDVGEARR